MGALGGKPRCLGNLMRHFLYSGVEWWRSLRWLPNFMSNAFKPTFPSSFPSRYASCILFAKWHVCLFTFSFGSATVFCVIVRVCITRHYHRLGLVDA
jgi:hypothetical protein